MGILDRLRSTFYPALPGMDPAQVDALRRQAMLMAGLQIHPLFGGGIESIGPALLQSQQGYRQGAFDYLDAQEQQRRSGLDEEYRRAQAEAARELAEERRRKPLEEAERQAAVFQQWKQIMENPELDAGIRKRFSILPPSEDNLKALQGAISAKPAEPKMTPEEEIKWDLEKERALRAEGLGRYEPPAPKEESAEYGAQQRLIQSQIMREIEDEEERLRRQWSESVGLKKTDEGIVVPSQPYPPELRQRATQSVLGRYAGVDLPRSLRYWADLQQGKTPRAAATAAPTAGPAMTSPVLQEQQREMAAVEEIKQLMPSLNEEEKALVVSALRRGTPASEILEALR